MIVKRKITDVKSSDNKTEENSVKRPVTDHTGHSQEEVKETKSEQSGLTLLGDYDSAED
jgi:hypothetical protein